MAISRYLSEGLAKNAISAERRAGSWRHQLTRSLVFFKFSSSESTSAFSLGLIGRGLAGAWARRVTSVFALPNQASRDRWLRSSFPRRGRQFEPSARVAELRTLQQGRSGQTRRTPVRVERLRRCRTDPYRFRSSIRDRGPVAPQGQ